MKKRAYSSPARVEGKEATRRRILDAARSLFREKDLDAATMADVAEAAKVGASTVYATFGSKSGILRELYREALFGAASRAAIAALEEIEGPIEAIAASARVARHIYDGEREQLGELRMRAARSTALAEVDQEFEALRFEMQRARVERLSVSGFLHNALTLAEARRVLWMYTSRDVYRMLAVESGWGSQRYFEWLEATIVAALVSPEAAAAWKERRLISPG